MFVKIIRRTTNGRVFATEAQCCARIQEPGRCSALLRYISRCFMFGSCRWEMIFFLISTFISHMYYKYHVPAILLRTNAS